MKRETYFLSRDHLSDKGLNVPGLVAVLVLEKVICCAVTGIFCKNFCLAIFEPDDKKKEG